MSSLGYTFESFQRLEDFSSYTSVIRCFGKPIIPPLLTSQERQKISQFRAALQEKQALKNKKKSNIFFENCENSKKINGGDLFSSTSSDVIVPCEFPNQEVRALSSLRLRKISGNSSETEMLVSMSKMPCNGICSTVHDTVIVCSDEIKRHPSENISTEPETCDSNSEYCESYSENSCDCQACRTKFVEADVPYKNALAEQMCSVSEDEQGSVAEDTEFGSLPTVIYNRKIPAQDTDSESIVTCMTQSTDLEKYMDCSIEYSSPDDLVTVSQSSNRVSVSSTRSDDASTETMVNTESELTPCASAMAELNDFTEGSNRVIDNSMNIISSAEVSDNDRAYSVDSYMKILRTCAKNLYMKKSQSEPSQPEADYLQNSFLSSEVPVSKTNSLIEETAKPHFSNTQLDNLEFYDNSDIQGDTNSISSDSELKPEGAFQRNHIRRNSYTLLHPSSALMMAHADCQCQGDPLVDASPHSCSSQNQNAHSNGAFKKETVNIVLPPTPDREKRFPVLNYGHPSKEFDQSFVSGTETGSSVASLAGNQNCNCDPLKCSSDPDSSLIVEGLNVNLEDNSLRDKEEHSTIGNVKENQNLSYHENSSLVPENLEKTNNESFLAKLFVNLKESHQLRINQLVEEQNKQWLKLVEEFKDQERGLFEKLKSSGIPVPSDDTPVEQSSSSHTNLESSYIDEQIPSQVIDHLPSSDSNSTISETESYPTVIQNDFVQIKSSDLPLNETNYVQPTYNSDFPKSSTTATSAENAFQQVTVTETNEPSGLFTNINSHDLQHAHIQYEEHNGSPLSFVSSSICTNTEQHALNLPVCSAQDLRNFKQAFTTPFILSDISNTNGPIKNFVLNCLPAEENIQHGKLTNEVHSPKQGNEPIDKIPISNHSEFNCSKQKICNLNKESNCIKSNAVRQEDQLQSSTAGMTKKNKSTINENVSLCNKNINKSDNSSFSFSTANINHDVKSSSTGFATHNSDLSKANANKTSTGNASFQAQATKTQHIPYKSTVMPSLSPRAIKFVSPTLIKLKQKQNKDLHNPDVLKRFEKLPAFVKGYLTRRLLKTERVQGLIKTIKETAILMQNLSEELTLKGNSVSERDLELYNQLFAQLLATFEEVFNIFCTISTKERMKIISESRSLRLRKNIMDKLQEASNTAVLVDRPLSVPAQKQLSSATLKSLQRRKRSIDSRTYTVHDFKECRARARSACSLKSRPISPSQIYQASVGLNLNRKTKSCVRATHTKHWK